MCAVRAILCALLACLPLLAGLRRLVLLIAVLLLAVLPLAETFVLPVFFLTLPCSLLLLFATFVLLEAYDVFVPEVECFAAGLSSAEACGTTGNVTIRHARAAAVRRIANWVKRCRREVALIISLYLYLWLLDA